MGNAFSSSNAVHIQLAKPYVAAGDVLEGVVAVNTLERINTNGIYLEVVGSEDVNYTESTATSSYDDDFGSSSRMRTAHIDFFRANVTLGPSGVLNAGQYQFGFKLPLPADLTPSFYNSHGGDRGEVRYVARARVDKTGFDLTAEQLVTVVPAPAPGPPRPVGNAGQQDVTQCCCISQGSASIQVNIDKDRFSRGEPVVVTVQARNNTGKTFNALNVNLKRLVALSTSANSNYAGWKNNQTPAVAAGPGLRPGEAAEGGMARRVTLQIPGDVPPSVYGRLVRCHYVIEAQLDGSFGVSDVKTQVPIIITTAPPEGMAFPPAPQPDIPAGWKPQVYPTVEVAAPQPSAPAPMPAAPQQAMYAPQQATYAPQQPTYAPQQPTYAPQQPNYAPQQATYAPQQPTYAPPPPQPSYAPQQATYAPPPPAPGAVPPTDSFYHPAPAPQFPTV